MFINNESANVSSLLSYMCTQVNALSDQSRTLSKSMVPIMGLLVEKIVTYFGNRYLNLYFSCICLNCC